MNLTMTRNSRLTCGKLCSLVLIALIHIHFSTAYGQARRTEATPNCPTINRIMPIRSTRASAGFFSNLRHAERSILNQTDKLLNEGRIRAHHLLHTPKIDSCTMPCSHALVSMRFVSRPHKTLTEYSESKICKTLLRTTTSTPIVYRGRTFESEDDARSWYKALTLGDGADGKDLYRRCPGSCSPSYETHIYRKENKLHLTTTVICGHARDKADDTYDLSLSLQWICPE
jgi:hypothetical protein